MLQIKDKSAPRDVLAANFRKLKNEVLTKRPVLAQILQKRGKKNLYEYAIGFLDVNLNEPILKRQKEFIETFKKETTRLFGEEIAKGATDQLSRYYFVSTADHHGPICHPYFLNPNLVNTITCLENPDPFLKNIIVLSCANVSFANSSFPRGLMFTSFAKNKAKTIRLGFFPNSSEMRFSRVYNYKPYSKDSIEKIKNRLTGLVNSQEINKKETEKILNLLGGIYARPEILECKSFSDQITKTNFLLWKKIFGQKNGKSPNLLYIELENLVVKLLINHHLHTDTAISRIIFNSEYSKLFIKYFDRIAGGFSIREKIGTYLFWAKPQKEKYCKQLWKEGDELVSTDKTFKIKLKPDSLKKSLEEKILIPSTQLSLLLLSLYYGLKCLGGFCQVNYLTQMKAAYIKMQADLDDDKSIEVCARVQTKELGEDLTIAFLAGPNGEINLAASLDIILYGNGTSWPHLVRHTKEITLKEALNPMMPEFYRVVCPEAERQRGLADISASQITKLTGLDKKIKACADCRW
jgi:hypothetical protein